MADQQARDCMPYDGVMGSLPGWIPHNFHIKFETSRNRLLDSRQRTHADLLEAIDDVLTVHSKHIDTDAFALYEAHIGGDDKYILVLARIFHAVHLGEKEGLALLTDSEHAKNATIGKNRIANAQRAIAERLRKDPKQLDKKTVRECWELWQNEPDRYKGNAAFARDMLQKYETLTSQPVIERWCRNWKKESGTQPEK